MSRAAPLELPGMSPALRALYVDHMRLLHREGLWLSNQEKAHLEDADQWTHEDSCRVWRRIHDCETKAKKVLGGERVPDYLKSPHLNILIPEPLKSRFEGDPRAWSPSKLRQAAPSDEDVAAEIRDVLVPSLEEALRKTEEELREVEEMAE